MIVNKNLFPLLVFGRGHTQSIIMCSNGSPIAGIGFKGAGGILLLGFPMFWHIGQERK